MSCCSSGCCTSCKVIAAIVALFLTVTSIAALLGVWNTHMVDGSWTFGSSEGSFAILAFVLSIMAWKKLTHKLCGCGKGGCGGGGCNCGSKDCADCSKKM